MKKSLLLLFLCWSNYGICQLAIGVEFQAYPTGFIPGIHIEYELGEQSSVQGRLGYNIVRHRDLGVHDDERGGGFGGTLGYRYYFKQDRQRWMLGARVDLWWNKIDWKEIGSFDIVNGITDVTVFQPTLELGYALPLKNNFVVLPTIAFGAEINIKTDGAEVGQGAILLLGASLVKRF